MTTLRVADRFRVPKIVWIWLERLGLTPLAVLRHTRLPSALYDGERTSVSTAQFFALWRSIAELRPQPDLGLRLARELKRLGQLPPATLASFYARDYRDALRRLSRFKQLCSPEEMHLHEARGQCTVDLAWLHTREPTPPLLVDATLALILELGRRGTQTALKPVRVELVRRRGAKRDLEGFFGCAVSFGAARDMLVLRASDLARRFVTYNPELEMLQPSLVMALSGQQQDGAVREQVKWTLKCLLADNRPDIQAVARELGVSSRTLQRRIAEEGATFRELLGEARRELARTYLREPSIEINQLAHLVGYEDPNSFYRAFRSWEGMTPGRWRSTDTMV